MTASNTHGAILFVVCLLLLCYVTSLSSDRGTIQKVIVLPKDPTSMEELTLEEVEVFRVCLLFIILSQGHVHFNILVHCLFFF